MSMVRVPNVEESDDEAQAHLPKPVRAFVCTAPNPWNYPAKDRAGQLEQIEKPHLGELIAKLIGPGERKPFAVPPLSTPTTTEATGG